jgi:hypothetical protein
MMAKSLAVGGERALVRISEAARLRRVPERVIRAAIRNGRLRTAGCTGWTRLRICDLDAWIDGAAESGRAVPARDEVKQVRSLVLEALERDGGLVGPIRPEHHPLSLALDLLDSLGDE